MSPRFGRLSSRRAHALTLTDWQAPKCGLFERSLRPLTSSTPLSRKSERPLIRTVKSSLAYRMPNGTWDTAMHVVDHPSFPLSPKALYTPQRHTVRDAKRFYTLLGIENIVLVQPSVYGTDNSCMLNAIQKWGRKHARGVVELDPKIIDRATLAKWDSIGIRGARINLKSLGTKKLPQDIASTLHEYADLLRPLDWTLYFHVNMSMIPALAEIIPDLNITTCFDHFGSPDEQLPEPPRPFTPSSLPGLKSLLKLLSTSDPKPTYVKLSAPYRLTPMMSFGSIYLARPSEISPYPANYMPRYDPLYNISLLAMELMNAAPKRCVFGTDWPHTRFEAVDVSPFVRGCAEWAERVGGLKGIDLLFRDNAMDLLDAHEVDEASEDGLQEVEEEGDKRDRLSG